MHHPVCPLIEYHRTHLNDIFFDDTKPNGSHLSQDSTGTLSVSAPFFASKEEEGMWAGKTNDEAKQAKVSACCKVLFLLLLFWRYFFICCVSLVTTWPSQARRVGVYTGCCMCCSVALSHCYHR